MKKLIAILFACGAAVCSPAAAETATWNGVSSGFTSDGGNWIEGAAPATATLLFFTNTTERTLCVTNDLAYNLDTTEVLNGSWEFASTEPIVAGTALLIGGVGETVNIVNYADWTCNFYFAVGNYQNSTVVFTNRTGTIRCKGSGSAKQLSMSIGGRYNQHNAYTGVNAAFVFEGGTLICDHSFEVGYGRDCTGVFEQTGGTITASRLGIANTIASVSGATGTVLLKGGTFATQYIDVGSGAGGSVTFDGGTLQLTSSHSAAIEDSAKLAVNVGAGGGTISLADGVVSTIPASISSAVSGGTDGGLKIRGGGRLVFTGALSYTGATTVEVGTTVVFADPSSIGGGLAVTIPETSPDAGVYTVFSTTGDGTLEEAFAAATLPAGDANARFRLSADKKSILCLYGDVAQEWIGGSTGSLGDAANWSTGIVPTDGNAVISSGAAATLASSAAFTPDSITFPSGTAQITISGEAGISGLLAVTNEASGVHHVFECPVSFAANAEADIPCAATDYLTFTGGMTAYTLKTKGTSEAYLSGLVTITKDIEDWTANVEIPRLYLVTSGTKLVIPNSVTVKGSVPNFRLASGAIVEIQGDYTLSGSGETYFSYCNAGIIKVAGAAIAVGVARMNNATAPGGVFVANGYVTQERFVLNQHTSNSGGTWVVGEDGMAYTGSNATHDFYTQKSYSSTLRPSADFAIDADITSAGSSSYSPTLTIGTTDYFDSSVGRKVTVNGVIGTRYLLNVTGIGEVVFNSNSTFARGTVVSDSATLAVNAGYKPGSGAVTMNDTSTLKVAQSGAVALGGNLTLAANASLAFNFTESGTAPTLALKADSTIPETVNVKVSANGGLWPKGGTYTLTSGYDFRAKTVNLVDSPKWVKGISVDTGGNIVLEVKPRGTMIVVR